MAKIVQSLTRASKEYEQRTFQSLVRDLDNVINKLNTTFQDEIKQEVEAKSFFFRIMATVNLFKFFGVDNVTSTDPQTMFGTTDSVQNPLVNEVYIINL